MCKGAVIAKARTEGSIWTLPETDEGNGFACLETKPLPGLCKLKKFRLLFFVEPGESVYDLQDVEKQPVFVQEGNVLAASIVDLVATGPYELTCCQEVQPSSQ